MLVHVLKQLRYQFLKMPKLKRASSSLISSQAKKRKKKQREDPVKLQQQRETDRSRHQADFGRLARPHLDDNSRRLRDAAARRQVRLDNPERKQLEQERDTAARRQVRLDNTERRQLEQERDTAAHQQV